jgi:hypothetical protein
MVDHTIGRARRSSVRDDADSGSAGSTDARTRQPVQPVGMAVRTSFHRVEIDAPDGSAALELERRLAHLEPTSISRHGSWIVEIPAAPDPDEIVAVVRHWLDDIGSRQADVRVDGRPHVVVGRRDQRGHRATNADFIG